MEKNTTLKSGEFRSFTRDELKVFVKEYPEMGNKILDLTLRACADYGLDSSNPDIPKENVAMHDFVKNARKSLAEFGKRPAGNLAQEELERRSGVLTDLLIDLMPGIDKFEFSDQPDGLTLKVSRPDGEVSQRWIQRLVGYDINGKVSAGNDDDIYIGRNKIARLWMTFNSGNLNALFNFKDDDFNAMIEHVRNGDLPQSFISHEELKRVEDWGNFMKNGGKGNRPVFPAFASMVVEGYRKHNNLKLALSEVGERNPYNLDKVGDSHYLKIFNMVPLSDHNDDPGFAKREALI